MMKKFYHGFTIIELIIVIVIVAILLIIGVAYYTPLGLKGRRSDGISAIMSIQLAEERYRSNNSTYGTLAQIGSLSTSPQGYYTLAVSSLSAIAYTVTATGVGTQANDKDGATACGTLTLTVNNNTVTQTPAACWPS